MQRCVPSVQHAKFSAWKKSQPQALIFMPTLIFAPGSGLKKIVQAKNLR